MLYFVVGGTIILLVVGVSCCARVDVEAEFKQGIRTVYLQNTCGLLENTSKLNVLLSVVDATFRLFDFGDTLL